MSLEDFLFIYAVDLSLCIQQIILHAYKSS